MKSEYLKIIENSLVEEFQRVSKYIIIIIIFIILFYLSFLYTCRFIALCQEKDFQLDFLMHQ